MTENQSEQTREYLERRNRYRRKYANYDKYSKHWLDAVALLIEEQAGIVKVPKKRAIRIYSIPFLATEAGERQSKELEAGFCYGLPLDDVIERVVLNVERRLGCRLIHSARSMVLVLEGERDLEEKLETILETGLDPDRIMGELDRDQGMPIDKSVWGSPYLDKEFTAYGTTNRHCKNLPFLILSYRSDRLTPFRESWGRNLYLIKGNPQEALVSIMKFYQEERNTPEVIITPLCIDEENFSNRKKK